VARLRRSECLADTSASTKVRLSTRSNWETKAPFKQDPKYAIRLLADIAIKGLSPAINDPRTAVQVLDKMEDLLLCLGRRKLDIGEFRGTEGRLTLLVPSPTWEELRFAFDGIRYCGSHSVQVMRRMRAPVTDRSSCVPETSASRTGPLGRASTNCYLAVASRLGGQARSVGGRSARTGCASQAVGRRLKAVVCQGEAL
jgi:hypothetical protein